MSAGLAGDRLIRSGGGPMTSPIKLRNANRTTRRHCSTLTRRGDLGLGLPIDFRTFARCAARSNRSDGGLIPTYGMGVTDGDGRGGSLYQIQDPGAEAARTDEARVPRVGRV